MEAQDYLNFHTQANIKVLYKVFLGILEDVKEQHDINFSKLFESLPEEQKNLIIQANYLDERAFDHFRKKILDAGNDCSRNIQTELAKFDVNFKR